MNMFAELDRRVPSVELQDVEVREDKRRPVRLRTGTFEVDDTLFIWEKHLAHAAP